MPTIPQVPYHLQNLDTHCGAGSAMMAAGSINPARLADDQDTYQAIAQTSAGGPDHVITWNAFPDGLTILLRSLTADRRFGLYRLNSEAEMTRFLGDAIEQSIADPASQRPPIVLVRGHEHWVVVVGFRATGDEIAGFVVHDPGPGDSLDTGLVDHTLPTDRCGTGMNAGQRWGTPHYLIGACEWRTRQMIGVTERSRWNPRNFLAIAMHSTNLPYDNFELDLPATAGSWHTPPCEDPPSPQFPNLAAVVGNAQARLEAFPFEPNDPWQIVRDSGAVPLPPLPVGGIGAFRPSTLLVPFVENGRVPMAIRISTVTGELLELWALPGGDVVPLPVIQLEAIAGRDQFPLGANGGPLVNVAPLPRAAETLPLVWAPSVESPSALPFCEATELETGDPIYVRIDGVAFRSLTPTQA